MILHVLGSSSIGNCYILENETEALVIECGVSMKEVKKAIEFNVSKVVGALVSHEHGDHAAYINDFLKARINVYLSAGTNNKVAVKGHFLPLLIEAGVKQSIGRFTVLPFLVQHDAAEPLGFIIHHPDTGNILFATDTYYLKYTFANLSNVIIECNYRKDILEANIASGKLNRTLMNRTIESHMSFETCKETLLANDLSKVNNIVLIHLSDGNSNAREFQRDIHSATGKTVHVADKGMTIYFNKTPF